MIELQTHSCDVCGEQFSVACESQLQEKLKKHKSSCRVKRTNKKRERTKQLQQDRIALYVHDIAVNRIEEHGFNELIKKGVVVHG